jgi:hypothetical protein
VTRRALGAGDDSRAPKRSVGSHRAPVDTEWKIKPSADDDLAIAIEIDRHDLLSAPSETQRRFSCQRGDSPIRAPSPGLPRRSWDGTTVFDEVQHESLHFLGVLARLTKARPLVETSTDAVVSLDRHREAFETVLSEFRQSGIEQ